MARMIHMGQSLGFSLREIEALNAEYQTQRMTAARGAEILRRQLFRLEEKAAHINAMMSYIRAKVAWVEGGEKGPEPNFTDYAERARRPGSTRVRKAEQAESSHVNSDVIQTISHFASENLNLYVRLGRHNCLFHCVPHPANVLAITSLT